MGGMDAYSHPHWANESPDDQDVSHPLTLSVVADEDAPTWLAALPHAAAILRTGKGGVPVVEHGNAHFLRAFPALLSKAFNREQDALARHVRTALASLASGSQRMQVDFDLERVGPIGVEVFRCSIAPYCDTERQNGERLLLTALDRTAERRVEESLRRELVSDTLTTLPNRTGFGEALEALLIGETLPAESEIAIIIIDLARFSRINESLGSMAGDELILTVAKRLKAALPPHLLLARLNGDEFAVSLPLHSGVTDAMTLAERLKAAIVAPIRLASFELSIDCAIGCSISPVADADPDELIRQAQAAVRTAKRTDRLEVYRAGALVAARQRFLLESKLRDALVNGGLHLVFQPLIDLATNGVVGFEALARWNDAELGFVSPNDFIPVAEESGLIVQLGRWALNEAMRQLERWDRRFGDKVPLRMSVNLSPIQMARDDVISTIGDALRLSGMSGERLTVEMTESALVGDAESCRNLLAAIKNFHVAIAMDDFGTGYSNLGNLKRFPIDVLKIDRSFVSDMLVDKDKHAIIRAILSIAEALDLRTTAEGIETGEVADELKALGCTTGQGYYFARPMAADDAYAYWLARWNFETI